MVLPDQEAAEKGPFEPEDQENAARIQEHADESLSLPAMARAVQCGEAAACIRFLRDSQADLAALEKELR
ncbi:MAG: hypothetical protein V1918_03615 [Planctomycetota bacterium]